MNTSNSLSPEQQIAHVESIIVEHPEVAGLQAYEYLRNDNAAQKESFIAGEAGLNLSYGVLTVDAISAIARPAKAALETLIKGEDNDKSIGLFNAIEYRYSELFMLSMARDMVDSTLSDAERLEAQQWFVEANEALYGVPEQQTFDALAQKHLVSKLAPLPDESVESSRLRTELSSLLGSLNETEYKTFVPDEELVARIGGLVSERFDEHVAHINIDLLHDAPAMAEALAVTLNNLGGAALGWTVRVVKDSSALAVSAHQMQVEVGENRPEISGDKFRGKNIHEVGVHALRSINAKRAGWLSAAYGQEGYLDYEEALATALENASNGKFADSGEDYYLIAGLAYGLDNHAPRDFSEVYEIMWRMGALKPQEEGGDDIHEHIELAKRNAFTACMRLFRGTDTHTPGVIYLKDLAYFKGQELAWQSLKDVQNQDDMELLLAGKLDLTQTDHLEIARKIVASNKQ